MSRSLLRGAPALLLVVSACGPQDVPSSDVESITASFSSTVDPGAPTHVIAVGYSHGMGSQFVETALARAHRYRELYPTHQIVFFGSPETEVESDARAFTKFGIKVISDDASDHLSGPRLLKKMAQFSSIESFDFYGHSSAWGIGLESGTDRLGTDTPSSDVAALRGRFSKTAYATLNGCSSGGKLAPYLSRHWGIPVAGALTGSNFQRLHSNGAWYVNDEGAYPAGGWATRNAVSYTEAKECGKGACLRLKPVNSGYVGYWGNLSAAGLGFYKFFCAYEDRSNCTVGMAKALVSYPTTRALKASSSFEDFEAAALDFLCPNDKSGTRTTDCRTNLKRVAAGDRVYSPFQGNTMKCDLNQCYYEDRCDHDANGQPVPGTCGRRAETNARPTTYADEFLLYMDGFAKLSGRPSSYPAVDLGVSARPSESTARCYVTSTDGYANVRRSAGGEVFEKLVSGNRVTRTAQIGEWAQVEFAKAGVAVGTGGTAYVHSSLLRCVAGQEGLGRVSLPNAEKTPCNVVSADGFANVRSAPNGSVLRRVNPPLSVYPIEQSGEWTRIEFSLDGMLFGGQVNQKTWIHSSLVQCSQ